MKKLIVSLFVFIGVVFPSFADNSAVLDTVDRRLYKEIFALQEDGEFYKADAKIKKIDNDILLSYVYAERYLHKKYYSRASELNAWLKKNPHHIDALRIYNLSVKKKGNPPIKRPQKIENKSKGGACHITDTKDPVDLLYKREISPRNPAKKKQATALMNRIYRALKRGKTLVARNYIESKEAKELFSRVDYDSAITALAFAYYIDGNDDLAIKNSKQAVDRSGSKIVLSHWVYGLSNYRIHSYTEALKAFKEVAHAKTAYKGMNSAGAFFASRTAMKMGRYKEVNEYLKIASRYPFSFYGVIAKRALGHRGSVDYYDEIESIAKDSSEEYSSIPEAMEVLALLEIGKKEQAYKQFKHLYYYGNDDMRELLVIFANENDQTDMLDRITLERGRLSNDEDGRTYYPVPKWQPYTGWYIDKALVYAFIRQESCFNKSAKSKAGARGLMQIMPSTAAILAKDMNIKDWSRARLFDPEENITLGQKYIEKLLKLPAIDGNLFFTAIAYNAGPGNLVKWIRRDNYGDDALLFIESIPSRETRDFVKKVISNFWIYRSLLNKHNPSLDDVVSGSWPMYTDLDEKEN